MRLLLESKKLEETSSPGMTYQSLLAGLCLLTACGDSAPSSAPDSGTETSDASIWNTDAGLDASEFPLPVYRFGQRSASGGFHGPFAITGTLSLPSSAGSAKVFEGWKIYGHGPDDGELTISTAVLQGQNWVATIQANVPTFKGSVALAHQDREIMTAVSPNGNTVLTASFTSDGSLDFSLETTAIHAMSLAGVRQEGGAALETTYYFGAAPGDVSAFDSALVDTVATMLTLLTTDEGNGIDTRGFAKRDMPVFAHVDATTSDDALNRPSVQAASLGHIGTIDMAGNVGSLAIWLGYSIPSVPVTVLPGTTRVGFFNGVDFPRNGEPTYARIRHTDGRQSPASNPVEINTAVGDGPPAPVLTKVSGGYEACGASEGNWILFMEPGTEIAVGFNAQRAAADGCATLATSAIPDATWALIAYQVTEELRFGSPSELVFTE